MEISGIWIILFWFVTDLFFAWVGIGGGVAHWAHVGGFLAGVSLGILFFKLGWAHMAEYDNPTLLDLGPPSRTRKSTQAAYQEVPRGLERHMPGPRRPDPQPLPPQPRALNVNCPHCSQNLDVPADLLDTPFACPACNGSVQVE